MKTFHSDILETLSKRISDWSSGSFGFASASGLVLIWLIAGPIMHFSEMWQLFINTTTTTITFLMVFLIQRSERKDTQALHLKLNAIMRKLDIEETMLDVEHSREQKLDSLEQENQEKANKARDQKRGSQHRSLIYAGQAPDCRRAERNRTPVKS